MLFRKLQLPWRWENWSFPKQFPGSKLELGNQETA